MIQEVLPLPLLWLCALVMQPFLKRMSLNTHLLTVSIFSFFLVLGLCGVRTCLFYSLVAFLVIASGEACNKIRQTATRKAAFAVAIFVTVAMIIAYLATRKYVLKMFVYLPSLSYLGFRAIAYLVSQYKRSDIPARAALAQMFFFPMLLTGPISRVEDFLDRTWDMEEVPKRLALGLSMLIGAHFVAPYIIKAGPGATLPSELPAVYWAGFFANSFYLYWSFSGYIHLVIGLGLLLGFRLPDNFRQPYLSNSVSDFWRRWHVSLSYWIRDYVYIP